MICKYCNSEIPDDASFCPNCGANMKDNTSETPNAAERPNMTEQFGAERAQQQAQQNAQQNARQEAPKTSSVITKPDGSKSIGTLDKTAAILICLFLGEIGIHNFIFGETKKGIFKIVTTFCCGLSFIFMLIDLIKICTDSYVIDPNALI